MHKQPIKRNIREKYKAKQSNKYAKESGRVS